MTLNFRSKTVAVFKAQPTCITQLNCEDCTVMRMTSPFRCTWCPGVHRCSDGADRLREHWDQVALQTGDFSLYHQIKEWAWSKNHEWKSLKTKFLALSREIDNVSILREVRVEHFFVTLLQNECGRYNISKLEQCAASASSLDSHTEWRTSSTNNADKNVEHGVGTATLVTIHHKISLPFIVVLLLSNF